MNYIYNVFVYVTYFIVRLISPFNKKLSLFVKGRKETFKKLSILNKTDKTIWFHVASLGEFEQARPIIEYLKKEHSQYKIVVTFFSPSGYEIRKNYALADVVCYLPIDTQVNAKRFIKAVHPNLAIMVKYEFWPNMLQELKDANIKTILVSGIFRKKQAFFKRYGTFMRNKLQAFDHFFIQNKISQELLTSINYTNSTVAGDTRFDRVYGITQQNNEIDFVKEFKNNSYTIVAGSTWSEDETLLVDYINNHASKDEKFIIAPHNIKAKQIKELQLTIEKKSVLFSEKEAKNLSDYQVFIIDTIGLLTKIYSYANVAYVGGSLATGLHNILEPATYGIPVIFGNKKYHKFQEANDLLSLGGAKTISNKNDFSSIFTVLRERKELRDKMGSACEQYVQSNLGATQKIINYIKTTL